MQTMAHVGHHWCWTTSVELLLSGQSLSTSQVFTVLTLSPSRAGSAVVTAGLSSAFVFSWSWATAACVTCHFLALVYMK